MVNLAYKIRTANPEDFMDIGELMVSVYSELEGFPKKADQPAYYHMLANIGEMTKNPGVELLVAISSKNNEISGAVVYFGDMKYYGSGGSATSEKNAAGFRLLAVNPKARGQGIGKILSLECINKAKSANLKQVIIHSTKAMPVAWRMYKKLKFVRSEDLDFLQEDLPVYGFRHYISGTELH